MTQQQPEQDVQDPTAEPETAMLVEPTQPQAPVRPVSDRRDLLAHLARTHPDVRAKVKENSKVAIANFKLIQAATPETRSKPLASGKKEKNRDVALAMFTQLDKVKKKRTHTTALQGSLRTGDSQLTATGKNESVKKAHKDYTKDSGNRDLVYPYGNRKGAVSDTLGEVLAINPGFKIGEQTLQILGHLSEIFMHRMPDMEYQSMLVNDRLFVAANAQNAIAAHQGKVLQDFMAQAAKDVVVDKEAIDQQRRRKLGALSEALKLDPASKDPLTAEQIEGAAVLAEYDVGYHVDHDARDSLESVLKVLQHQASNSIAMVGPLDPVNAAACVADDAYRNKVILVQTPTQTGWHAEQALALMLITAGWSRGARVGGTKNPCFTCWLTLNLLPQCGFPLEALQTPGFIWESNTVPGLTHVAKALHIKTVSELLKSFDAARVYTEGGFRQFMTAMSAQKDLVVDVTNDDLAGRRLTQASSQRSFNLGHMVPEPEEITGGDYPTVVPTSPPGTYGTPPGSPRRQADERAETSYQEQQREYERQMKEYQEKLEAWQAQQEKKENDF
jgi:hypothetical protein